MSVPAFRRVRALSGDATLLREIGDRPFDGRVHSVFARAINVERNGGGLVTIASRDAGDAPATLVVDAGGFATVSIEVGAVVRADARALVVANRFGVALAHAKPWTPIVPRWPADASRLRDNLAAARRHVGVADAPCSALARTTRETLDARAQALCAALRRGDADALRTHGCALLGLGHGLTPSGDDFLVGLFAVLAIAASPCERLAGVAIDIVADAGRRTNAISVAALAAAAHGRVRESIGALVRTLIDGDRERALAALRVVLAIGSTSGADIATGVFAGFEVQLAVGSAAWTRAPDCRAA